MEPKLAKCTSKDLDLLVQLSIKTFKAAFEKDNNPDDFEAYLRFAFNPTKLSSELNNKDSTYFFITLENTTVGYFKVNVKDAQKDLYDKSAMELERIYILEEYQGRKLGSWALLKVLQLAKKYGKQYVWLGVWEHNLNAILFYERFGFKKFGEHPYYIGNDEQTDWLMKKDIL